MYSAPTATPELIARRKASWALETMCRMIGLGTLAHGWCGEYADEWIVVNNREVRALVDGRRVADCHIELTTNKVRVVIPDVHDIIRVEHSSEFYPEQFGIEHKTTMDVLGNKDPDLVGDFELPEDLSQFEGPPDPFPRSPHNRRIEVEGSLR